MQSLAYLVYVARSHLCKLRDGVGHSSSPTSVRLFRVSRLPVSFLLHVKYTVSYRIVSSRYSMINDAMIK